jgi:threonine synthase
MDISKASNFERFVFDLLDGDGARVASLWKMVQAHGEFDLGGTREFHRAESWGFRSGSSSHAQRIAAIRQWRDRAGVLVDTHTADGLVVAQQHREAGVPMICMETAKPAKFAEAIREAIGEEPLPPPAYRGLESMVQRYTLMPADVRLLKRFIAART